MEGKSREFQVFAKPVGAKCNLRCSYCYYRGRDALKDSGDTFRMAEDVLERYIISQIEASTGPFVFFSWHGGEPLLAGIDFFRNVTDIQRRFSVEGKTILNGIQTNATLIDEEWCRFLADEDFFIGVSIDGPEEMHNKFRVSEDNRGSFRKAIRGYELLKKHNVRTELLTVVHSENSLFPVETYHFLRGLEPENLTFLPCVERDPGSPGGVSKRTVEAGSFGNFMSTVFDEWIAHDIGRVKIQIIEEAVRVAFGQEHTLCIFRKTCGGVPVLEHNGDLFSCDHFVNDTHLLGNIKNVSLAEILDCDRQKSFGQAKLEELPVFCLNCGVLNMCNGECPKNRFIETPSGEPGLNYLCSGYMKFFNHIHPFVNAVAIEWNQRT
jgi:uncharacterized protein